MQYVSPNFKTKKALKDAVAAGDLVTVFAPGLGLDGDRRNGEVSVGGPHYPKPHRWYARVKVVDGVVVKVVS